jgi:excisionase family DNA binding protein
MTLINANEVSTMLGLSLTKVYELARSGEIPCFKFGSQNAVASFSRC